MHRTLIAPLLTATFLFGCVASSAHAEIAFSESYGQLFAIDPNTGEHRALGSTGLGTGFEALAFGPGGNLLGITSPSTDPTLYEIDPRNGTATLVGSMGLQPPFQTVQGLAADALGRWWVSAGDLLYSLDPLTAETILVATLDHPLDAIAAWGDRLYAVTNTADALRVEQVDLSTGLLEPIVQSAPLFETITDASFDSQGDLRLLTVGGGILTVIPHAFYRIDLEAGTVEQTYFEVPFFGEPHALIWGLALRGGIDPITIPTLGSWGASLLVFLILMVAFTTLARHEG